MNPFEDYYDVLQVHHLAEPEVIHGAYKELAKKYHPDKNRSSDAAREMKNINIAYEVLSNPEKRKRYDMELLQQKARISDEEVRENMSLKSRKQREIQPRSRPDNIGKRLNRSEDVVIIMARCSKQKRGFGIRLERIGKNQYVANWAFSIKEASAKREGYDSMTVKGAFATDTAYPGCPHCGAISIVKCGCNKVGCWDGESKFVTCPWCGKRGKVEGQIESLGVESDR